MVQPAGHLLIEANHEALVEHAIKNLSLLTDVPSTIANPGQSNAAHQHGDEQSLQAESRLDPPGRGPGIRPKSPPPVTHGDRGGDCQERDACRSSIEYTENGQNQNE